VRVKRLTVGCFDLPGNAHEPLEVDRMSIELADDANEPRVLLPRPLAECHSVRLTVDDPYGPPTSHATIAEIGLVAP
jgi:hypothetical protein